MQSYFQQKLKNTRSMLKIPTSILMYLKDQDGKIICPAHAWYVSLNEIDTDELLLAILTSEQTAEKSGHLTRQE